ncbi:zinc ribbon domain-containing protein [Blautia sp. HCP3S3_H10_1]|uniref:zinc ribbon domain-containing protein n=1 Tax=unclassified Blautia TaxID=2648079 RepID=UPI003F8E715E
MSKKCVKCGQSLPDNASFCPHCTAIQNEKTEMKAPRRWKKKALMAVAALVLLAAAGVAVSIHHRPQTYEGGAQITYEDKGRSYKVLLTFSQGDGVTGHAQGERTDTLSEGMDSALPCQLYVLNQETGELAWEEFTEEVESCRVDAKPGENSQKVEYIEPVHNESFPDAAYVSDIYYTADSGTNDILWTLTMKNGDTISLSTRLTIEKQAAVTYFAEDTPMETTEELNALLASIEEEVPSETPVYLHLPAVTYEGDITFGNHVWGIYGSTEGEAVTTFTGTVSMKGLNGNYAEITGVDFQGDSGIGLNAYCLVLLSYCSFDGGDTAAVAQNGAWVNVTDCNFTNNTTALKFCTSTAYGTAPEYLNNTFTGNGTAVCIEKLPGTEVLDFAGSIFSGNDTDIDNKAEHPVDTTKASFE